MILLYTVVLLLLSTIAFFVRLRARSLERKFADVAKAVDVLARQPEPRPGNSNRPDLCQSAKRTFQLGELVARRDRVELKHYAWQRWSERLTRWLTALRDWKGKKLPYTLGALDVWLLMGLIDRLGASDYFSTRVLIEKLTGLFGK